MDGQLFGLAGSKHTFNGIIKVDLGTTYLGLQLRNPLIVAACPLTRESHQLEQLEQAGAAAAVMYSLFAEQVEGDELSHIGMGEAASAPVVESAPLPGDYVGGIDDYLRHIELSRKAVKMPIIASLNGSRMGEWVNFARLMEQAGADALELNIYFVPTNPRYSGSDIEQQYCDIVAAVREQIRIPLTVKLGPFFSSLPNLAVRLESLGANGLVLFNRFLQPDIDIETFAVSPRLTLSTPEELRLPLRWIAILRSRVSLSLASSSGAHTSEDVIKLLLAGADVVSMASALLRNGPGHIATILEGITGWMQRKGFASVDDFRGLVHPRPGTSMTAFERSNYVQTIVSYNGDDED
jgi:dihydroorotate dehydrogenase (fumarate)